MTEFTYRVVELDNNSGITDACGHDHRSVEAAEACYEKLTASRCGGCGRTDPGCRPCRECGNYGNRYRPAKFYHSTIERSDGARQCGRECCESGFHVAE